jgi:predicted ATP-binding protein involved in virulence
MEQFFVTYLTIKNIRHLKNISIPLSDGKIKHLILTGKNGSGKTSVVEALAKYLDLIVRGSRENAFQNCQKELDIKLNNKIDSIPELTWKYNYILAYYKADRVFQAEQPKHIEKVQLKDSYELTEFPRMEFVKYLLDLKMTEALARSNNKAEKADEIHAWFAQLEQLLKQIFDDETVKLEFDEETYEFYILQQGKEPFGFNTLSSGYQAVLDIVLDIMMRMQRQIQRSFDFKLSGIVLIDEIEAHLHLELQKNFLPFLTKIFPNIQFIVTSHSPFILNSISNAVIYDLEKQTLVEHGLGNIPYDGIVEGYFKVDKLSEVLREKFERYKELVYKENLLDDELGEIAELEFYLDEVPDYLAIGITTEYQKMKVEFMNREDIDG